MLKLLKVVLVLKNGVVIWFFVVMFSIFLEVFLNSFELGLCRILIWFIILRFRLFVWFCLFGVVLGMLFISILIFWILKVVLDLKFWIDICKFWVKLLGFKVKSLGILFRYLLIDSCCWVVKIVDCLIFVMVMGCFKSFLLSWGMWSVIVGNL